MGKLNRISYTKARKDKKLKQEDISRILTEKYNIPTNIYTVKSWTRRTNPAEPERKRMMALSDLLGVPLNELDLEIGKAVNHIVGVSPKNTIRAEVMSATAAAGTGNNVESVDLFSTGEYAVLDERLFKVKPKDLKLMKVDGYSMAPMLYPDSWVAYEPAYEYTTDGLYVINYGNELMVKLLQYNPQESVLEIISKNPDYKSYKIRPDDQSVFRIVGRVLRSII